MVFSLSTVVKTSGSVTSNQPGLIKRVRGVTDPQENPRTCRLCQVWKPITGGLWVDRFSTWLDFFSSSSKAADSRTSICAPTVCSSFHSLIRQCVWICIWMCIWTCIWRSPGLATADSSSRRFSHRTPSWSHHDEAHAVMRSQSWHLLSGSGVERVY